MFGSAGEFKICFHDENIPADEPWLSRSSLKVLVGRVLVPGHLHIGHLCLFRAPLSVNLDETLVRHLFIISSASEDEPDDCDDHDPGA